VFNRSVDVVKAEIARLEMELEGKRAELARLESQSPDPVISPASPTVHNHSSPAAKIHLFVSLFRARPDVYARRFESVKTGKSGVPTANSIRPSIGAESSS
jgi:hypothetical protein